MTIPTLTIIAIFELQVVLLAVAVSYYIHPAL